MVIISEVTDFDFQPIFKNIYQHAYYEIYRKNIFEEELAPGAKIEIPAFKEKVLSILNSI